jgi:hypothetical protein
LAAENLKEEPTNAASPAEEVYFHAILTPDARDAQD